MSKVVILCAGYGGSSQGIKQAGFEIEVAYDNWDKAFHAHQSWHPDIPAHLADVREIKPFELRDRYVWASLPCQPWSVANRTKKRGVNHPQYYSLEHFAWQVRYAKAAIIENVSGLITERDGKEEIARLEKACHKYGLSLSINLIPSSWLGGLETNRYAFLLINCFAMFQPMKNKKQLELKVTARETGRGRITNMKFTQQVRRSEKEQARIRQVPIEHIKHLPKYIQGTLIGNAVPPIVAENVVRAAWL